MKIHLIILSSLISLVAGSLLAPVHAASLDPSKPDYAGRRGTTGYVSKLGDNSDGRSWKTAFHTIQKALDAVPDDQGGHQIIVRPDTYVEANLAPARKGASGAYNALICDFDGRLGSGAKGWGMIDSGDPEKGFKSWDWWSSIRASDKNWSGGNNKETFSSIIWDRWSLRYLYTAGGDAGLFWDLTNKSGEGFTVLVEDCVGTGRAFGGGVVYPTVRENEPSVFRRCYFLALDWVGDTAAVLLGGWEKSMPEHPHAVFEDCTLVHPDNAVAISYASHCARARFVNCRLIVLNFTQPEMGGKSTGIICTEGHAATGRLHVDLEDCILAGYSVFTTGEAGKAVTYTTKGKVKAYVQFKQSVPKGFEQLGLWPTDLYAQIAPPNSVTTSAVAGEAADRTAGGALSIGLSDAHLAALNRPRRIYVNNDVGAGVPMGAELSPIKPEAWVASRFSAFDQPGSQVDSVGWCLDEGNIAAYPSKVLPELQYPTLLRWREEGVDIAKVIVQESHRRGLEAFWEYRLNGADRKIDVSTPALHPLKEQHPEWLVKDSWWKPGLWNFAVAEVRKYKVAILREVAANYDLDGINLDFGRHPPFLPTGQQWEQRESLTDFVRQVRLMLQEVAQHRGRPFLLSVRVADTVPGCHYDGLDIETWVRQNLVDMIIIGTRSIQVDMPGFRRLVEGSHVKLYPCIDQHHSPDGYHAVTALEFLRGLAVNWRHQGADGIATFNFWNETPEAAAVIGGNGPRLADGRSVHAQAYRELGDPAGLALLDKWFVVSRRYGGGWEERWNDYLNMNPQAPLPLELPPEPAWVEVYVGDDVAAHANQLQRLELRLQISGEPDPKFVWVKFNGIQLQNPVAEAGWWTFALTPKQMVAGRNLLTVRYVKPGARENPIVLQKVEVHVRYRSAGEK